MKRVPLFIAVGVVASFCLVWRLFAGEEVERYRVMRQISTSPSEIRLSMSIRYARGAIAQEDYFLANSSGISTARYRVMGRAGTSIAIESLPRETYDVSFSFEKMVQDGIWELPGRPGRGDTSAWYTIVVSQTVVTQHGEHSLTFTDPHYWATTAGRQYHIHLDGNKPVPDILGLASTTLAESRYERLVDDFRAFGSEAFRAKVKAARVRVQAVKR